MSSPAPHPFRLRHGALEREVDDIAVELASTAPDSEPNAKTD